MNIDNSKISEIYRNTYIYCYENNINFRQILHELNNTEKSIHSIIHTLIGFNIPLKEIIEPDNIFLRILNYIKNERLTGVGRVYFIKNKKYLKWEYIYLKYDLNSDFKIVFRYEKNINLRTKQSEYAIILTCTDIPDDSDIIFYNELDEEKQLFISNIDNFDFYNDLDFNKDILLYYNNDNNELIAKLIDNDIKHSTWRNLPIHITKIQPQKINFNNIIISLPYDEYLKKQYTLEIKNVYIDFLEWDFFINNVQKEYEMLYDKKNNIYFIDETALYYLFLNRKYNHTLLYFNSYNYYLNNYIYKDLNIQFMLNNEKTFLELNTHEKMKACGYTVNKSNYKHVYKFFILEYILSNNIINVQDVISYLVTLVIKNKNNPKLQDAVNTWRDHIQYIISSYV